jgi:hypothetical protein
MLLNAGSALFATTTGAVHEERCCVLARSPYDRLLSRMTLQSQHHEAPQFTARAVWLATVYQIQGFT